MIWLTVKLSGVFQERTRYSYGYTDKESVYTNVVYMNYYVLGMRLLRIPVWVESVPSYAAISFGALGYTSWVSARPYLMDAANKKRKIFSSRISLFDNKKA